MNHHYHRRRHRCHRCIIIIIIIIIMGFNVYSLNSEVISGPEWKKSDQVSV